MVAPLFVLVVRFPLGRPMVPWILAKTLVPLELVPPMGTLVNTDFT